MEFSFTTKSGKFFTATYSGDRDYFIVNDHKLRLIENDKEAGDALECGQYGLKSFLATLDVTNYDRRTTRICLRLEDADFMAMKNGAERFQAEKAATHELFMSAQPIQYQLRYNGLWADGYCIPTEVIVESYRIDKQGKKEYLTSQKWKDDYFPLASAVEMAEKHGLGCERPETGYFSMELTAKLAAEIAEICTPLAEADRIEYETKSAAAEARRKANPHRGVEIKYGDGYELWDGIRME